MERQWNALGHSSMASAIYAESLFATGYVYRGTDVAANVSGASWQNFSEYIERAHDVFDASADEGHECPLWSRRYFQISLSDGSSDQRRRERFEHALTFDPHDINIHFARAYQLTPRWGGSYDEIEVFAREAIGRTSDVLGCALYARIYWSLKDTYNLPDTLADWGAVEGGLQGSAGCRRLSVCGQRLRVSCRAVRRQPNRPPNAAGEPSRVSSVGMVWA
jgi:hypothetical protein